MPFDHLDRYFGIFCLPSWKVLWCSCTMTLLCFTLWYAAVLLTPSSTHVLWDFWCHHIQCPSHAFRTKSYAQLWWLQSCSLFLWSQDLFLGRHYSQWESRCPTAELMEGSISLQAGELLAQKASLEQGSSLVKCIHPRKIRCNAICQHSFFSCSPAPPAGQSQTSITKVLPMVQDHVKIGTIIYPNYLRSELLVFIVSSDMEHVSCPKLIRAGSMDLYSDGKACSWSSFQWIPCRILTTACVCA